MCSMENMKMTLVWEKEEGYDWRENGDVEECLLWAEERVQFGARLS